MEISVVQCDGLSFNCRQSFLGLVMRKIILVLILSWGGLAQASPFVCFTDKAPTAVAFDTLVTPVAWAPSCKTIEHIGVGIDATSLVLSSVGLGMACTGVGAPATLWLEGIAIGIQAVGLMIGQLPCDASAEEAEIRAMAEQVVCEELIRQGISCSYIN